MNKFFKYIIPCMSLGMVLTSCYDEVDDKSVIDKQYEKATATTVTLTAGEVVDYQTLSLTATLSDTLDIIEQGFQVSTSEDFADAAYQPANRDELTFAANPSGLEGLTTYYARAYAFTNAGQVIYSESTKLTTPRTPIYDINTTFLVHEYEYDEDAGWQIQVGEDGSDAGYYLMSIEFAEGSETDVLIHGFLGFDATIVGVWDPETSTVTIPGSQVVGEHPTYGPMFPVAFDMSTGDYAADDIITLQFKSLGGSLVSTPYTLSVSAGYFGIYTFTAIPYEGE